MSSTATPDLQDRVQTITDAFAAFDESRVAAGGAPTFEFEQHDVEKQLERLCAYRVPADEAVRTLVRKACADAGLATALTYAVARERGEVTHQLMAWDLEISSLEAEVILGALRPVVHHLVDVEVEGVGAETVQGTNDS
jgi:hypothetical protein